MNGLCTTPRPWRDAAGSGWHNGLPYPGESEMQEQRVTSRGGCLCGGVRYSVRGSLRDVVACHCLQCRRTSGHFVAATGAEASRVTLDEDATLVWYGSAD